jgi:hypothetical protein
VNIHFVRSGGFAGLVIELSVNSADLPAEEANALQQDIEAADFFALPTCISSQDGGADRFQYQITIEDADRKHTVEVGEAALPDTLRPLIRRLELLWRMRR